MNDQNSKENSVGPNGMLNIKEMSNKVKEVLEKLYNKLPNPPFLGRESIFLLILSIFFFFFLVFIISYDFSNKFNSSIEESPLILNSRLSLTPSEKYVYEISFGDGKNKTLIFYDIYNKPNCEGVVISEVAEFNKNEICVLPNGSVQGSIPENSIFLIFSQWMLAVSENFSYSVNYTYYNSYLPTKVTFRSNITYLGKEKFLGREAFKLRENSNFINGTLYVDQEKRILLGLTSEFISVRLLKAPFEIS